MSDAYHDVFEVVALGTWDKVVQFARQHLLGYIFRGQSRESYSLSTTLERIERPGVIPAGHFPALERQLCVAFQRRAHHYLADPPGPQEWLEWFAHMQHHGAPTRLLDFTYSFYVAAHFAMDKAEGDAAVWAIHTDELDARIPHDSQPLVYQTREQHGQRYRKLANAFLGTNKPLEKLVFDVVPFRLHERLVVQQGTFLLPADITSSFEKVLAAMFGVEPEVFHRTRANGQPNGLRRIPIRKIILRQAMRRTALTDLEQMNISEATLFPGLDGFARSLRHVATTWPHASTLPPVTPPSCE